MAARMTMSPKAPMLARTNSKRHHQPFVRSVAIHQVDPLPGNCDACIASHKTMQQGAAEDALALAAIFQQLEFGANGASVRGALLDRDIADHPAGARARLLRI